jgi:copper resistance protein C
MNLSFCKTIVASLALAFVSTAAFAHTSVSSTTPKSGAELDASPPVVSIAFKEAAQLTSVVLIEPGKPERALPFEPRASATEFKIADPKLGPGRSEIQWKALSKDGHVVTGKIILTVKSTAAKQ